ncbi:MAG: glycosyltransferase [Flavobacteriales bacterium TMED235]|nr:MAG: glycosyltransferase [Flavobacteriales bacterium TMED235]
MKKKIKILRIIHSLDPKWGGPPNAIIDHSKYLINLGLEVDILVNDEIEKKHPKVLGLNIFKMGKGQLGQYGFNLKMFIWLYKNRKKYDFFIIHGLWSFYSLLARILVPKKFFIFTHGQLDPYFGLNFSKSLKKKIYWSLIEKKNLLKCKSILVTTKHEKMLLNQTYVNTKNIKKNIIRYGIFKKNINKKRIKKIFHKKYPFLKNKNFLLFLGRFHSKKGCDILINSIKFLKERKIEFYFLLAGPESKEKNYFKKISKNLGLQQNIYWSDAIYGDIKFGAILASDAMVLPSHGENFGVALVESLSMSRPVITTNKVNIYKDLLKYNAGIVSKDNLKSFTKSLIYFNSLTKTQRKKLSQNSLKCFNMNFNLGLKDKDTLKIFRK